MRYLCGTSDKSDTSDTSNAANTEMQVRLAHLWPDFLVIGPKTLILSAV